MEAIIFVGLQAAGKSTFYKERFFNTHVRINLDMLRTRHREKVLLQACLEMKQMFVVDKTNPTVQERAKYIVAAKTAGFRIVCYYFVPDVSGSFQRNSNRSEKEGVPPVAIPGTFKRLQPPTLSEGFDALYSVILDGQQGFIVEEIFDEI